MPQTFVGIDPAAESFTAALYPHPAAATACTFPNTSEGVTAFAQWLRQQGLPSAELQICIENTGVYAEALCYQLHESGYSLSLLDPRKVWKAFPAGQPKSDPLDSRKIAEYGFRYADQLRLWQPQEVIIEQIRVLLSTREQLVQQKTATQNTRSTLARKVIQTPAANQALEATLTLLKAQIATLEDELKRLIRTHPTLLQGTALLLSAPGVGWLLSAHLLVLTRGFAEVPRYRTLAQYLGLSPNEHTSGTSVRRPARSRRYGPATLRKLLHLAARTLRTHDREARHYFLRKTAEGKPKALVLNNIANQLLKRLCAILRSRTPYIPGYRSVDPRQLALA